MALLIHFIVILNQGTEFIGNKARFKKYQIRFTTKHLTHKASFSEQAIYLVKLQGQSQIPQQCLFFLDMYLFMKVCTNLFFPG